MMTMIASPIYIATHHDLSPEGRAEFDADMLTIYGSEDPMFEEPLTAEIEVAAEVAVVATQPIVIPERVDYHNQVWAVITEESRTADTITLKGRVHSERHNVVGEPLTDASATHVETVEASSRGVHIFLEHLGHKAFFWAFLSGALGDRVRFPGPKRTLNLMKPLVIGDTSAVVAAITHLTTKTQPYQKRG